MKWPKTNQAANEGVSYVQDIVNRHGSIFRSVPQETNIGIDGLIELVHDEKATGQLIAVQIKSGESYVAGDLFVVNVDQRHLDYWSAYILPVIIICYSPEKKSAPYII